MVVVIQECVQCSFSGHCISEHVINLTTNTVPAQSYYWGNRRALAGTLKQMSLNIFWIKIWISKKSCIFIPNYIVVYTNNSKKWNKKTYLPESSFISYLTTPNSPLSLSLAFQKGNIKVLYNKSFNTNLHNQITYDLN